MIHFTWSHSRIGIAVKSIMGVGAAACACDAVASWKCCVPLPQDKTRQFQLRKIGAVCRSWRRKITLKIEVGGARRARCRKQWEKDAMRDSPLRRRRHVPGALDWWGLGRATAQHTTLSRDPIPQTATRDVPRDQCVRQNARALIWLIGARVCVLQRFRSRRPLQPAAPPPLRQVARNEVSCAIPLPPSNNHPLEHINFCVLLENVTLADCNFPLCLSQRAVAAIFLSWGDGARVLAHVPFLVHSVNNLKLIVILKNLKSLKFI